MKSIATKLIYLILFFVSSISYPQGVHESYSLNEKGLILNLTDFHYSFKDAVGNKYSIRDYYKYTDPSKHGKFKLPFKNIVIAISPNTKPLIKILTKEENVYNGIIPKVNPSIKLRKDSVLVYKEEELQQNSLVMNDRNLVSVEKYFWFHGYYCVELRVNSVLFDVSNSQLHELKKISIALEYPVQSLTANQMTSKSISNDSVLTSFIINYKDAPKYKETVTGTAQDSTLKWIDFNASYVKFTLASNSIFRLTKQDLVDKGFVDQQADPKTFQLYESGNEVPVYIYGEDDHSFDTGDYIEFPGSLNYPKTSYRTLNNDDQEYNEYLNRYTDSMYYFLTWGKANGQRIAVQKDNLKSLDTLDYYYDTAHFEKNITIQNLNGDELANQMPDWNKNKTWYWTWLGVGTETDVIPLSNIYKNKNANIYMKLVSAGSDVTTNSHQLTLTFNNSRVDSQSVNRFHQVLLNGKINSNLLIEGNNQISVTNLANKTSVNILAKDWYDVEYPRQLIAQGDSLLFRLDAGLNKAIRVIKIKNVNAPSFVIYKIKPVVKKIESFVLNGNIVMFTDTTSGGDSYLLLSTLKTRTPQILYRKKFVNLRDAGRQADYIALTHPVFLNIVNQYANFIKNLYNVGTSVVSIYDVYDEFSFGYPYPESIRSFFYSANQFWNSPKPSYAVLIGDADYDYKKYTYANEGVAGGGNYVPSYGWPVSDGWYFEWGGAFYPQMMIGRIPINSAGDLTNYQNKINSNFNSQYAEWNKRYLFFSGGSDSSEIATFKSINDTVINNYIKKSPVGGEYQEFYKTLNPLTDFGPVKPLQFTNAIDSGAVVISYLGHSGTSTWDNSINEYSQLTSKLNRNPIIMDYGCSTNKFAEPDIISFGESFILQSGGQAIGYIGNSSLGFTTTSSVAPPIFFQALSSIQNLSQGALHSAVKKGIIGTYGTSAVYQIYALTNTLLGDPVVQINIPSKSNLFLDANSFLSANNYFSEITDSVQIKFLIKNLGRVEPKQYTARFTQVYNSNTLSSRIFIRQLPLLYDTLSVWIKTKGYPGQHQLELNLDIQNQIDEITKNDNDYKTTIDVYSISTRDLLYSNSANSIVNNLSILNPVSNPNNSYLIQCEIADNPAFQSSQLLKVQPGQFLTNISLSNLSGNKRYWFHYKTDAANSQYSLDKSFFNSNTPAFYLNDQYSFAGQKFEQTRFNSNSVILGIDSSDIKIYSAGGYSGANCVISRNGLNLLTNNYFSGMGVVVFDAVTLNMDYSNWYSLFNEPAVMQQLVTYLNSIPANKIVAIGVSDDAANNITSDLKNALKALGSTKIDSIQFRGSWAMIGKRNAKPGDVLEKIAAPFNGAVSVENLYTSQYSSGKMTTQKIGPVSNWKKLTVVSNVPANTVLNYRPVLFDANGKADTLSVLQMNNNSCDLSNIDAKKYPYLQILSQFTAASGSYPVLNSLGIDFKGVPELGTNYQVVSIAKDTVVQGENIDLSFSVYNVGGSTASNFRVIVEVVKSDNSKEKVFDTTVDSIGVEQKKQFIYSYSTTPVLGHIQFNITIDPDNKITELYKDNNIYSIPAYIKTNTTPATMKVTFDGSDIVDGDYISVKPDIKIELNDLSMVPIIDTTVIKLYLNGQRIYFGNNSNVLVPAYSSSNPKLVVTYKPSLASGNYTFKVWTKSVTGQVSDSVVITRKFQVDSELKLLDVYNYPNPFSKDTYFTFKLTQIPDEMKIRIFTVAGRLIKEFVLTPADLRCDFNRILWNGRDQDGDKIANGVYLYKIVTSKNGTSSSVTQKLAVVR